MKIVFTIIMTILVSFFIIIFFTRYPINGFMASPERGDVINDVPIRSKNKRGGVGFEVINKNMNWDTVCIVPPYSYSRFFSPYSRIREFYGKNYNRHRIFIPDPSSVSYGVSFSFLKNENLSKLVHIPRYSFSLSLKNGVVVKPTTFDVNGKKISFDSLTFDIPNNQKCFARGSAYILISENRIFKIGVK